MHAGGSGIGTIAIRIAKSIGCTVITTVGSATKADRVRALGADYVINYREERFEGVVRKLTGKRGVDVVFEHVGADTWNGSLLSLRRGGRLVADGHERGQRASTIGNVRSQQDTGNQQDHHPQAPPAQCSFRIWPHL